MRRAILPILLPFFVTTTAHAALWPCGFLLELFGADNVKTPPVAVVVVAPPIPLEPKAPLIQADFAKKFAGAGLTPANARVRADDLQKDLEALIARLGDAPTDDVLKEVLATLNSGALLAGTGHAIDTDLPVVGPGNVKGWANHASAIQEAETQMAARAKLTPGFLRPPDFVQFVAAMPRRPVVGDGNAQRVFISQTQLYFEEYGHLIQELRVYGGMTGAASCLSQWGRQTNAVERVDKEADVYAWLREQSQLPLPTGAREFYPSRRLVPLAR